MNDQAPIFKTSQLEAADAPPRNMTANPTMGELISARFSRRGFLQGSLAVSAIAATVSPLAILTAQDAKAAERLGLLLPRSRSRDRRDPPRCRRL
jgi:secreted PhoX family phosphatase